MKNNQINIIHIVGNRPQFIKLAVLHKALAAYSVFPQLIIHSGQHYSPGMSEIFFRDLHIPTPDIQFESKELSANQFIGATADSIAQFLETQHPLSLVIVYGDTNTTLAGAIAASRANLALLHFEAGVRTSDTSMPEEINRVLTDRLANVNYCCTQRNLQTLLDEGYGGIIKCRPVITGDLMFDAFQHFKPANKNNQFAHEYIVATIHRAANITDSTKLKAVIGALNTIHKQTQVIVPLHPHTEKKLEAFGIIPLFTKIPPLGYSEMQSLLHYASAVITDSGGTSRESFFSRKKSLIIMESPFWPEIVEAEAAVSCRPDAELILAGFHSLGSLNPNFDTPIFGNGKAAFNIASDINSNYHSN